MELILLLSQTKAAATFQGVKMCTRWAGAAKQPTSGLSFSPVGSGSRQRVLANKQGAFD